MSISKIICVVVVVFCITGSLNAVMVDDFESYALGTNLQNNGGWSVFYADGTPASPTVEDATTTSYPEFSNQFMMLADRNTTGDWPEYNQKTSPTPLSSAGDYVQLATYVSSEVLPGGINAGAVETRVLDAGGIMLRFGVMIDWHVGNQLHWFYNDGAQSCTKFPDQITNPCSAALSPWYDNWYVLRATLRDADVDGVVDSYDFTTYDAAMNPLWYELGISTQGKVSADTIVFGPNGKSPAVIALLDEVEFAEIPEPATLVLLSMGCIAALRRRRK